jgi:hypothetical protein
MTSNGYFLGAAGTRYDYSDIADRIRRDAPHTLGEHIFVQLRAICLYQEFLNGTTPCGLPLTFAENPRIAKFTTRHDADLPDHVFVTLDERFDVTLIRTRDGLKIEVYPITDGDPWDDPCARLKVDESEIRELEAELGDD